MSEWYEPEDEDISVDRDREEVDIFVKSNEFGNVYITLTFEQIMKVYNKL